MVETGVEETVADRELFENPGGELIIVSFSIEGGLKMLREESFRRDLLGVSVRLNGSVFGVVVEEGVQVDDKLRHFFFAGDQFSLFPWVELTPVDIPLTSDCGGVSKANQGRGVIDFPLGGVEW